MRDRVQQVARVDLPALRLGGEKIARAGSATADADLRKSRRFASAPYRMAAWFKALILIAESTGRQANPIMPRPYPVHPIRCPVIKP
jgi:hypothetical protein